MKVYFEGGVMQNILFDAELSVHKFGSHLLHVPSLLNWANSKGLYLPETDPPIDSYKFVQVELLLRTYVRDVLSITPEDGFKVVQINSNLNGEKFARHPMTARWLLATYASNKMINRIVGSIETGELKLLNFEDKAPITEEQLDTLLLSLSQVHQASAGSDGLMDWLSRLPHTSTDAMETLQTESEAKAAPVPATPNEQLVDEEFASWFDDVSYQQLAEMFKEDADTVRNERIWRSYRDEAHKNGLKAARVERAKFNPYRAGLWWLDRKSPTGWNMARMYRTLANNLPVRSLEHKPRLTGDDY